MASCVADLPVDARPEFVAELLRPRTEANTAPNHLPISFYPSVLIYLIRQVTTLEPLPEPEKLDLSIEPWQKKKRRDRKKIYTDLQTMMLPSSGHHFHLRPFKTFRASLLDFIREQNAVQRREKRPPLLDLSLLRGKQFLVLFLLRFVVPIPRRHGILPGAKMQVYYSML